MKIALVTLFSLLALASARILPDQPDLEELTAYNYLEKIGLPLAEKIRKSEENSARIVGGSAAALGAIPYQAGLLAQFGLGQGVCGASLVSTTRLVTAAHCWWDGQNQATSLIVVLGSIRLFSGGTRVNTNQVVMHSSWTPSMIRNDIAMILLPSPVTLSSTIATIALPTGSQLNELFVGENAIASGFGRTSDDESGGITTAQVLSQVTLPVISNSICWFSYPFTIQDSNICASGANARSTCNGDSGGPLAIQRSGSPLLVGVTSFGSVYGCQVGYPPVFARITSFISFINQYM